MSSLESALTKLQWSAQDGTWSATLKPEECAALLEAIRPSNVKVLHPLVPTVPPQDDNNDAA